jgi:phosphohistidine phosphatase SixA
MAVALAFLALLAIAWPQMAQASEAVWQALRNGGTVALFRHARAPGSGDPAHFRLDDCATQRNLSAEGREQAQRIGEAFRERQIPVARVLSSRWCRALDTARLAFGALAERAPPLDSFFAGRDQEEAHTRAVRQIIQDWRSGGVLVLITHQVNITALTEVFPSEGEMLVLRPRTSSGFDLIGRIKL